MAQRCEPGCEGCTCHITPPCEHCSQHVCVCGDPGCDEAKCDHDHIDALTEKCRHLERKLAEKHRELTDLGELYKETLARLEAKEKPPCRFCGSRDCPDPESNFWKEQTHLLRSNLAEMHSALAKHRSICSELEAQRDILLAQLKQQRPWWRFWK